MKKIAVFLAKVVLSVAAFAYTSCRQHTFTGPDGKITFCETCCDSRGNCSTRCF